MYFKADKKTNNNNDFKIVHGRKNEVSLVLSQKLEQVDNW